MIKMKKYTLLSIAVFGLFFNTFARPVDLGTAKAIASKFMGTNDLQLATTYTTDKNEPALYVFNTLTEVDKVGYDGFYSYEWVKRWVPELEGSGIAFHSYADFMRSLDE